MYYLKYSVPQYQLDCRGGLLECLCRHQPTQFLSCKTRNSRLARACLKLVCVTWPRSKTWLLGFFIRRIILQITHIFQGTFWSLTLKHDVRSLCTGLEMMPFIKVRLSELRINGEPAQHTGSPSSLVSLQRGSHAVLERRQPSWGLSSPTGPTFQLNNCCLASAWSTAPATFHLHHGLCSSMPISQTIGDVPLKEQSIPREGSDARGRGCPRPPRLLLLVGGGTGSACPQGAPTVPIPWFSQHLTH